jgi:hypothetical protein
MKDNKQWGDALYCDCEDDLERSFFFSSGRAVETGIVAPSIAKDVARAFYASHYVSDLTYPPALVLAGKEDV